MWTLAFIGDGRVIPVSGLHLSEANAELLASSWQEVSGLAIIPMQLSKAKSIQRVQLGEVTTKPWEGFAIDLATLKVQKLPERVQPRFFETWQNAFRRNPNIPDTLRLVFLPT